MNDLAPVYAQFHARLRAVAITTLKGSGLDARAAVTTVFTRLCVRAEAGDLQLPRSGWEPYLVTAVRRASLDLLRQQRGDEPLDETSPEQAAAIRRAAEPDPTGNTAAYTTDLARRRRQLQTALARIDERDRQILNLKHWHNATNRDIGKALGVTGQRVGQLYADALKKLKDELTSE
jgi:RNA polymerase sigma factor (sigma-70 family)